MTRLDDFLKFLVTNYLEKVAQMFCDLWGILKHHFLSKNRRRHFLGNFRSNWATFLFWYLITLDWYLKRTHGEQLKSVTSHQTNLPLYLKRSHKFEIPAQKEWKRQKIAFCAILQLQEKGTPKINF